METWISVIFGQAHTKQVVISQQFLIMEVMVLHSLLQCKTLIRVLLFKINDIYNEKSIRKKSIMDCFHNSAYGM